MKAVLIPGDGIGKEISKSVVEVSEALQTGVEWVPFSAGADYYEQSESLMQEGLLDAIGDTHLALKGPTATPIGTGFRSINVYLRQKFDTYANVRPLKSIPGVPSRYENIDLVIIRENSEDLYKGIEYMYDADTAHGIKLITRKGSERIVRYAFEYAKAHNRKKVTCVHKANIMKVTDGLFLEVFQTVAKEYPDIVSNAVIVDAFCMKAVTDPTQFDVVVTENLYGDIISDLCAGLVGGLGFAPSVNAGEEVCIYEAVHGSAPDIAGQDIANPSAILLAFALLLEDNGMMEKAQKLKKAIETVCADSSRCTHDIGGTAGTKEFTKYVIEEALKCN